MSPDFNQMARTLTRDPGNSTLQWVHVPIEEVARLLQRVWNARGTADRAILQTAVVEQIGKTATVWNVDAAIERAIRSVDR